MDKIFVSSDQG